MLRRHYTGDYHAAAPGSDVPTYSSDDHVGMSRSFGQDTAQTMGWLIQKIACQARGGTWNELTRVCVDAALKEQCTASGGIVDPDTGYCAHPQIPPVSSSGTLKKPDESGITKWLVFGGIAVGAAVGTRWLLRRK